MRFELFVMMPAPKSRHLVQNVKSESFGRAKEPCFTGNLRSSCMLQDRPDPILMKPAVERIEAVAVGLLEPWALPEHA